MAREATLFHARQRSRELARKSRFASLIASPFDLGTVGGGNPLPNGLTLPASGNIGISFSDAVTSGDITINSRATPDLAADQIHRLGYFEADSQLIPSGANAGTITLYYFDQWFLPFAIATGEFT